MEHLLRDLHHAARGLRREPAFAWTTIVTLALGCATTIAAFSVANAELWRPLPFPNPHQLAVVEVAHSGLHDGASLADLRIWNAESRLARYSGYRRGRRTLHGAIAESVTAWEVTGDYFARFGMASSIGRTFGDSDDGSMVAVLSNGAWRRLFAADRAIVGRTVRLEDATYTIVGVLARPIEFSDDPDFLIPLDRGLDRDEATLGVAARLAPGVTPAQAESELRAIVGRATGSTARGPTTVDVHELQSYFTGYEWRQLYFFLGGAALLLALAGLNVAGLLIARALRRQREFAIRGALGVGVAALIRQLLAEGALLAIAGVTIGIAGSAALLRGIAAIVPAGFLERGDHIDLDVTAAGFAVLLSVPLTIALAMAPLFSARRVGLTAALGRRTVAGSRRERTVRRILLGAQVTATIVLASAAGLLALSFLRLSRAPLGFQPEDRMSLRLPVPAGASDNIGAVRAFADRMLEQATATPGVAEATIGSEAPLDSRGAPGVKVFLPGQPQSLDAGTISLLYSAGPSYFRVLGIPILAGRAFTMADDSGSPRVCVVNERLARQFFPDGRAVGGRIDVLARAPKGWTSYSGPLTIVGVAANVRHFAIDEVEYASLYVPFAQAPSPAPELIVRGAGTAVPLAASLKAAMARVDASQPVLALAPLTARVEQATRSARFNLIVTGVFAVLAILIAGVGIYGAMLTSTEERTREFGIRLALGALPRAILLAALRESAATTAVGCGIGLGAVFVVARLLGDALYLVPNSHLGVLYGVSMTHPAALGVACALLFGVTLTATAGPARRAARTDPIVALRAE